MAVSQIGSPFCGRPYEQSPTGSNCIWGLYWKLQFCCFSGALNGFAMGPYMTVEIIMGPLSCGTVNQTPYEGILSGCFLNWGSISWVSL